MKRGSRADAGVDGDMPRWPATTEWLIVRPRPLPFCFVVK